WSLREHQPIPSPLAQYLLVRAEVGPWVERGDAGADGSASLMAWGTVACAPIVDQGEMLGLLLLAVGDPGNEPSTRDLATALSAAIDFAEVAAGLLARHLQARRASEARRLGIASVLLEESFDPHYQ